MSKSDGYRGRVGIQEFIDMFKEISTRPEIYFLMIRYARVGGGMSNYVFLSLGRRWVQGERSRV